MEIKKIYQDFSVCQVKDYSLANLDSEYSFTGKKDEEKSSPSFRAVMGLVRSAVK